jgi:hypothetical protein
MIADPADRRRSPRRPGDPIPRGTRHSPAARPDRPGPNIAEHTIATNTSSILAVENIDHTRTRARSPQTKGIVERFHRTTLDEFYRIAFRKKLNQTIEDLQAGLDLWMGEFNEARPHQGKWCFRKTPTETFLDAFPRRARQMRDGRLERVEAIVEQQQRMPPEGDHDRLLVNGQDG